MGNSAIAKNDDVWMTIPHIIVAKIYTAKILNIFIARVPHPFKKFGNALT